ncbi:hypothetical protein [Deinococcus navajonensis]|uniref:Uncharacterized protein n=1 Tax=Deinococcus navajonensis TaxID=309884 RepID=A0ABV8XNQ7_9DEIO
MTERDPFFVEVDAVLRLMEDLARLPQVYPNNSSWKDRRLKVLQEVRVPAQRWESTILQLQPYRKEVLQHVSRLFRAREGQMSRRLSTFLGSSRGAGILGSVIAALAVASLFSTLRTWLPGVHVGFFIGGFLLLAGLIVGAAWAALIAGHPSSHLLYLADLIDSAIAFQDLKAKEGEALPAEQPQPVGIS